jgi:hypothetical protein
VLNAVVLNFVMLNVVMLDVVMLNVVMLSVTMQNVVAPLHQCSKTFFSLTLAVGQSKLDRLQLARYGQVPTH